MNLKRYIIKIAGIFRVISLCSIICFSFVIAQLQEKPQYELSDIEFTGNESYKSSELKEIIISKESPGWFFQFLNSFSGFGAEGAELPHNP